MLTGVVGCFEYSGSRASAFCKTPGGEVESGFRQCESARRSTRLSQHGRHWTTSCPPYLEPSLIVTVFSTRHDRSSQRNPRQVSRKEEASHIRHETLHYSRRCRPLHLTRLAYLLPQTRNKTVQAKIDQLVEVVEGQREVDPTLSPYQVWMVGDSTMRHQYSALCSFLGERQGRRFDPYTYPRFHNVSRSRVVHPPRIEADSGEVLDASPLR